MDYDDVVVSEGGPSAFEITERVEIVSLLIFSTESVRVGSYMMVVRIGLGKTIRIILQSSVRPTDCAGVVIETSELCSSSVVLGQIMSWTVKVKKS